MGNYINIEELVSKSLEYFESKFDMPKKGIFAGGALANYVNYLYTGKKPIINDVDIFLFNEIKDKDNDNYNKYNYKILLDDISPEPTQNLSDYTHIIFKHDDATYYKLDKTERKDAVNYVYISTNNIAKKGNIIDSFDINQTQISIDLETKEVFYTKHFLKFLQSQKLEIVYIQSPVHSILRCLKKAEESNFSFDAQYYINLYKEMKHFNFFERIKTLFGDKYKILYDKYSDIFTDNDMTLVLSKHYYDKNDKPIYYVSPMMLPSTKCVVMYKVVVKNNNENSFGGDLNKNNVSKKITLSLFNDMHTTHFGKNKRMWSLFKKFSSCFFKTNYVDLDINNDNDVCSMKKIYQYLETIYPCLYNKTMSEQLYFISLYDNLDMKDKELINRHTPCISPIDMDDLHEKIFLLRLKKQK